MQTADAKKTLTAIAGVLSAGGRLPLPDWVNTQSRPVILPSAERGLNVEFSPPPHYPRSCSCSNSMQVCPLPSLSLLDLSISYARNGDHV
jgi:hypothetical protein